MDANECVRLFNESFKVGDVFLWRFSTSSTYDLVELAGEAYNNHNNAVAFIKEQSSFICVHPIFVKETNRDEIVVWLDEQYTKNKSFSIPSNTHRETITEFVDRKFGKKGWWSYDINPVNEVKIDEITPEERKHIEEDNQWWDDYRGLKSK